MAEGMAFDQLKPPIHVTDPQGARADGVAAPCLLGGGSDRGRRPVYRVVDSLEDEAAAVADGWYLRAPTR